MAWRVMSTFKPNWQEVWLSECQWKDVGFSWSIYHVAIIVNVNVWCHKLLPDISGLEWTGSHQCTSWGWSHSNRFGDELKPHPPLPKVCGCFSLFSAPMFFPPTYFPPPTHLTSFCVHSIIRARESLKWGGRRGNTGLRVRSGRAKVTTETKHLKRQNGSLKVSSLPSICFFLCLRRRRQRRNDNASSFSSLVLL
jgi:hypothetical protein